MIIGADVSKWQGAIDWGMMAAQGVRFVYAKASQGPAYADPRFQENAAGAKAVGILFGAYHFCTADNALAQVANFLRCIGDVQLDLPPALDVEKDPATGRMISGSGLWVMCDRLKGLQGHALPVVYCSQSSGNAVWPWMESKWHPMKENLLWVANWDVAKPALPDVWAKAGEPFYIWQDKLVPGAPFGVDSTQIDHDVWGSKKPFPGEPVPPPPAEEMTANLCVYVAGEVYAAKNIRLTRG
jgi:lysozyme